MCTKHKGNADKIIKLHNQPSWDHHLFHASHQKQSLPENPEAQHIILTSEGCWCFGEQQLHRRNS
jgi:hypothetical protein